MRYTIVECRFLVVLSRPAVAVDNENDGHFSVRRGYIYYQFLPCFRTAKLSDIPLVGAKLCRRRRQQQPDWATENLETGKQRETEETDATPVCCNNTCPCRVLAWPLTGRHTASNGGGPNPLS